MEIDKKFFNQIVNGDCLELFKELPDNCIDLVVTSPPYNCGMPYDTWDDRMKWEDYLQWCKKWLSEIYRVCKDDGRICINIPIDMGTSNNTIRTSPYAEFYRLFQDVGIQNNGMAFWTDGHRVRNTAWGSWKKCDSPYIYCPYEVIAFGFKKQWEKKDKGISTVSKEEFMMGCSGIWNLRTETRQHTVANFSLDLPEMCIKMLSFKGDVILDPFMGSGTTAVAAIRLHRNFIGFEISEKYSRVAKNRADSAAPLFDEVLMEAEDKDPMEQLKFPIE